MSEDELGNLAIFGVGEVCKELAEQGCDRSAIAAALASLLGALLASVDCCESHRAGARQVVLEIMDATLASHSQRLAAAKALPDFPPCEGHA